MKHRFNYLNFSETFTRDADKGSGGGSDVDPNKDGSAANTGDDLNGGAGKTDAEKEFEARVAAAAQAMAEKLAAERLEKETVGLRNKVDELIGENRKLKGKPTLTDEEYAQYRQIQERIARDELLKLMAEGKSEEALDIATKRVRAEYEAKITAEAEEKARIAAEAQSARQALDSTKISIEVTRAASTTVQQEYQPLLETIINKQLKVVDGEVRVVNEDGTVKNGANGKPMTVTDLIESLRPNYPALFKPSSGGGAGGSSKSSGNLVAGKLTAEAAAELPMDEFIRLRKEGKI